MARLFVVATPIGNLQDISPRAVETLKNADLIVAEDTRVAMKLCQVFDIRSKLTNCHQHNESTKGSYLAEKILSEDLSAVLTTDAGTPCISDPGYILIRECAAKGIDIIPVPGCCAAIAALSICGYDTREFAFYGFLPREKKELRDKLVSFPQKTKIAVIHESPYRVIELVQCINETLPAAKLTVCCDLTKLHEKTLRGTPAAILEQLLLNPKTEKGEYCIVMDLHDVSGTPEETVPEITALSLEARLVQEMKNGMSLRDAQSELILSGEKKNAVKQAALSLKKMMETV